MWPFGRKFPYTNFHELNLDWILNKIRRAVFSVNGNYPDDNGNVTVPQITGAASVNGIPADNNGNVSLAAWDVPYAVLSVNGNFPDEHGAVTVPGVEFKLCAFPLGQMFGEQVFSFEINKNDYVWAGNENLISVIPLGFTSADINRVQAVALSTAPQMPGGGVVNYDKLAVTAMSFGDTLQAADITFNFIWVYKVVPDSR